MSTSLSDLMPTAYRPDLGILVSRWTHQPPPAQLRPVYAELSQVAVDYHARYWLQDIRHRTFNDPEITRWLLTTYFPEIAGRLGGRLHIAYLASPALLASITHSPDFIPASAYENRPFVIDFFSSEGTACSWLSQQRLAEAVAL
jgi:hypothetical protein